MNVSIKLSLVSSALAAFIVSVAVFGLVLQTDFKPGPKEAHAIQWCEVYQWQKTGSALNSAYSGGNPIYQIKSDYLP